MSNVKLKLMVSVFTRRMASGETFEDLISDYQKLTENDINQIREALGIE